MSEELRFRRAVEGDLPALVALLRDDVLGVAREAGSFANYEAAFADIDGDSRHLLAVGEQAGCVVACLQATVLPCLTHGGRRRAQFEGIRVASELRGQSVGREMMTWAIAWAEARGCGVAQLSTDRERAGARRFYETLGFVATHDGMKLTIVPTQPGD